MPSVKNNGADGSAHRRRKSRRAWALFWGVYALLVVASNMWVGRTTGGDESPTPLPATKSSFLATDFSDDAAGSDRRIRVAYRTWGERSGTPIVLVHGSPGSGDDFGRLGPALAERGHWVIAPDLPGFGDSERRPSSYSVRSHARAVLALLDELRLPRAHVLGWSMGGGVVLNLVDLAPERVNTLTMLAAIGDQRTEGSGSYHVEHAKYALGEMALRGVHALTPHFGLAPDPRGRVMYSLVRNFGDTDQRPLTGIMERVRTPTLIISGAKDFLVVPRAPELQHRLIGPSRLVVIDAMHFMPFLQVEQTAGRVDEFTRSEAATTGRLERSEVYLARPAPPPFGPLGDLGAHALVAAPWWALIGVLALWARRRPEGAAAVMAALVNALVLDWGVGLGGMYLGVVLGQIGVLTRGPAHGVSLSGWSRRFERSPAGFWWAWRAIVRPDVRDNAPRAAGALGSGLDRALYVVGVLVGGAAYTLVLCLPLLLLAALIAGRLRMHLGWAGTGVSLLVLWLWGRNFPLVFTWTGRRILLARLARARHHEYWPSWIYYAPLAPYIAYLALRARHLLAFSACNPGIPGGGGLIGESKFSVQSGVRDGHEHLLACEIVRSGPSPGERAADAIRHIGPGTPVGEFPVILKPDAGQRGFSVRLARSAEHVRAFFDSMTRDAIVQRYHAGPHEVGVMWARRVDGARADTGTIYSITRKDFPYVEGDGRHTLEQLIYLHPRYRRQAGTFLARFGDDAACVIPQGERVRLAQSGNHCQGTLFRDGADLVTPVLCAALSIVSLSYERERFGDADAPGGLDVVRYDLRFASEDELRAGRGFGIVEINGTTGESTNIYDPERSLVWSYRVLFGQWKLLYELGAWRMARGATPWTIRRLVRELRAFYRGRPGSALAD